MYSSYRDLILCSLMMTLLQNCDACDPSKPIYACGKSQISQIHTSNIHASICKQLRYHEDGYDEPVLINRAFPNFTIIGTKFKSKVRQITMADNGELWSIEMQCPFERSGIITCTNPSANVTIWMVSFDIEQVAWLDQQMNAHSREIQRMKEENNYLRRRLNNFEQTHKEQSTKAHSTESEEENTDRERYISYNPFLEGTRMLVSLIPGFVGGLLVAALIAWKFGSDIQIFLRPFRYHMNLRYLENEMGRKIKNETTALDRRYHDAFNYLECIYMKIVKLSCKAESVLNVAGFDDLILSISGRGTYIDTSPCPNYPRFFHALSSCFSCRPNTVSDHAANIPEVMTSPWSMAVDTSKRCAYVSSYQNYVICCIPLKGGDEALRNSWKIFDGQKPAAVQVSLSMEDNGNVIAVSLESNWIEEYSSDGRLVNKIELQNSDDYAHIQHAVKRTDGHYVLVHGWKEDKYHRVCLVDGHGGLKASYGHSTGDAIGDKGQLNTPTHLVVDKNNFVLLTDYNNHRIILLDPDLKFVKVLITPEAGLYRPCRLVLHEREGQLRLYVGEDRKEPNARVMVFFLKRREAFC